MSSETVWSAPIAKRARTKPGAALVAQVDRSLKDASEDSLPGVRDGTSRNTVPDTPAGAADPKFGLHEPLAWYESCKERSPRPEDQ